ncbi:putative Ubiquitin carboxyl-terminal hydrolase [Blattamonas nauphoetae]|uniref:Ubiquitin carboxyl-terminal hydrolase n=1 Tax=Blattamonas nauphoetae TaxID=2049346 RepID=A0ABQ9X6Q2_9EUKA|nr:putative Ubiquitin carboxyl-terminal hydrolase [Blattamonas nauphoetae]
MIVFVLVDILYGLSTPALDLRSHEPTAFIDYDYQGQNTITMTLTPESKTPWTLTSMLIHLANLASRSGFSSTATLNGVVEKEALWTGLFGVIELEEDGQFLVTEWFGGRIESVRWVDVRKEEMWAMVEVEWPEEMQSVMQTALADLLGEGEWEELKGEKVSTQPQTKEANHVTQIEADNVNQTEEVDNATRMDESDHANQTAEPANAILAEEEKNTELSSEDRTAHTVLFTRPSTHSTPSAWSFTQLLLDVCVVDGNREHCIEPDTRIDTGLVSASLRTEEAAASVKTVTLIHDQTSEIVDGRALLKLLVETDSDAQDCVLNLELDLHFSDVHISKIVPINPLTPIIHTPIAIPTASLPASAHPPPPSPSSADLSGTLCFSCLSSACPRHPHPIQHGSVSLISHDQQTLKARVGKVGEFIFPALRFGEYRIISTAQLGEEEFGIELDSFIFSKWSLRAISIGFGEETLCEKETKTQMTIETRVRVEDQSDDSAAIPFAALAIHPIPSSATSDAHFELFSFPRRASFLPDEVGRELDRMIDVGVFRTGSEGVISVSLDVHTTYTLVQCKDEWLGVDGWDPDGKNETSQENNKPLNTLIFEADPEKPSHLHFNLIAEYKHTSTSHKTDERDPQHAHETPQHTQPLQTNTPQPTTPNQQRQPHTQRRHQRTYEEPEPRDRNTRRRPPPNRHRDSEDQQQRSPRTQPQTHTQPQPHTQPNEQHPPRKQEHQPNQASSPSTQGQPNHHPPHETRHNPLNQQDDQMPPFSNNMFTPMWDRPGDDWFSPSPISAPSSDFGPSLHNFLWNSGHTIRKKDKQQTTGGESSGHSTVIQTTSKTSSTPATGDNTIPITTLPGFTLNLPRSPINPPFPQTIKTILPTTVVIPDAASITSETVSFSSSTSTDPAPSSKVSVLATPAGVLTGSVHRMSNTPRLSLVAVANANVQLITLSGEFVAETQTGASGQFVFIGLTQPGRFLVSVLINCTGNCAGRGQSVVELTESTEGEGVTGEFVGVVIDCTCCDSSTNGTVVGTVGMTCGGIPTNISGVVVFTSITDASVTLPVSNGKFAGNISVGQWSAQFVGVSENGANITSNTTSVTTIADESVVLAIQITGSIAQCSPVVVIDLCTNCEEESSCSTLPAPLPPTTIAITVNTTSNRTLSQTVMSTSNPISISLSSLLLSLGEYALSTVSVQVTTVCDSAPSLVITSSPLPASVLRLRDGLNCSAVCSIAPTTGDVQGQLCIDCSGNGVCEQNGSVLANRVVLIVPSTFTNAQATNVDSSGSFSFVDVLAGDCSISLSTTPLVINSIDDTSSLVFVELGDVTVPAGEAISVEIAVNDEAVCQTDPEPPQTLAIFGTICVSRNESTPCSEMVRDATLLLTNLSSNQTIAGRTDANGVFVFSSISLGNYNLTVVSSLINTTASLPILADGTSASFRSVNVRLTLPIDDDDTPSETVVVSGRIFFDEDSDTVFTQDTDIAVQNVAVTVEVQRVTVNQTVTTNTGHYSMTITWEAIDEALALTGADLSDVVLIVGPLWSENSQLGLTGQISDEDRLSQPLVASPTSSSPLVRAFRLNLNRDSDASVLDIPLPPLFNTISGDISLLCLNCTTVEDPICTIQPFPLPPSPPSTLRLVERVTPYPRRGIKVSLISTSWEILATQTTTRFGFSFTHLPAGQYFLAVTLPAGSIPIQPTPLVQTDVSQLLDQLIRETGARSLSEALLTCTPRRGISELKAASLRLVRENILIGPFVVRDRVISNRQHIEFVNDGLCTSLTGAEATAVPLSAREDEHERDDLTFISAHQKMAGEDQFEDSSEWATDDIGERERNDQLAAALKQLTEDDDPTETQSTIVLMNEGGPRRRRPVGDKDEEDKIEGEEARRAKAKEMMDEKAKAREEDTRARKKRFSEDAKVRREDRFEVRKADAVRRRDNDTAAANETDTARPFWQVFMKKTKKNENETAPVQETHQPHQNEERQIESHSTAEHENEIALNDSNQNDQHNQTPTEPTHQSVEEPEPTHQSEEPEPTHQPAEEQETTKLEQEHDNDTLSPTHTNSQTAARVPELINSRVRNNKIEPLPGPIEVPSPSHFKFKSAEERTRYPSKGESEKNWIGKREEIHLQDASVRPTFKSRVPLSNQYPPRPGPYNPQPDPNQPDQPGPFPPQPGPFNPQPGPNQPDQPMPFPPQPGPFNPQPGPNQPDQPMPFPPQPGPFNPQPGPNQPDQPMPFPPQPGPFNPQPGPYNPQPDQPMPFPPQPGPFNPQPGPNQPDQPIPFPPQPGPFNPQPGPNQPDQPMPFFPPNPFNPFGTSEKKKNENDVYLVEYQGGLAAVKIIARGHNIDGEQKYAVHFYEKGIKNPFYIRIRMTTQVNGQFILMMDYANLTSLNHLMDGRIPPLPESVVGIFIRQIYYGILIPESEAHSSKDVVGTPVYLAPEIVYLSPHYSHKSDTWAIGVMMFTLLCRTYPFQGTTTHQLYTSIQSNTHNITRRDLSQHCTDAINALLCKTPAQRPSAKQALEFPFFKQFEEAAKSGMPWNMFSQVTSGSFAKPPPQTFFIPDTHHSERNYRHLSPLRKALSPPSDFSLHPVSSPHNPNHSPSPLSADATRRAHPLPKNIPKHIQNGARFPARQFIGPSQVCEICGKVVPMDQMQQHKESEHNPPKSSPAALRLPQLVPKNTGPAPQEATRLKFVGLVNPGLQCYLNIVVQSLFHIPLFRNLLLSLPLSPSPTPTDPLHVGLHRLFQAMLTSQTPVNTSVFTQTIHFPQFDVRQMNDTQDFFNRLVNGLNSELKNTPLRGLASSLLSGRLIRKLTLEQRGRKSLSVHPEHFWSLRMPIELGNGVEEVLPKLLFPDQSGNTQKIYSIPPVLFVDLVRWTSGPRGLMKNNKRFAFPTSLDFSQLIEPLTLAEKMTAIQKKKEIKKAKGKTPSSTQFPQSPQLQQSLAFNEPRHATQKLVYSSELSGLGEPEKEQAWMTKQKTGPFYSQSFRYSLLAVEVHSGSLTMGHYYSFIRPLGTREWFECNDETIRRVDEREAIEGQFGGEMNGREVAHSAMSLVYVQDCHVDRIGMKEPTRVHPHPVPKPDPILNQSELISLRQQCDRLQSQLRQAEENNKALNDKLKSTEAEKRTVSEQLQLEHDKEKENMKKETIRQEINHKNEIGSLRQQCDDLQSRLIQAQMLNTTRQQTIDDLTRKGNDLQNRYRTMEDERNHLNQTVLTLNDKFKNADQVQKELEAQIRKLEQEKKVALDNLKKEKETSEQLKLKYTKEKENMNNKIIDLEKEAEARKKELEDRKQEMARQENDHKNALEKLTHERNQFESRLKNLEKDTDTIVKELKAEREKDMDRLRQELESQKSQTGASQRTAEQSQEERWKMVENLKKEEREREKLQQEFENYKTQHQLEKGTLNTTQERITQLVKNNQDLESEIETLKNELQKSQKSRKAEEEMNRKKDEELRHIQTELNNLKVQFEQTNDKASNFESKWKNLEKEKEHHTDTVLHLQNELCNALTDKQQSETRADTSEGVVRTLQEELNEKNQSISRLSMRIEDITVQLNETKEQVQRVQREATHQVTETQKFNSDMKLRAEEEKHQEESRLWQENKRGLETQIRRLDEGVSNDKALITTLEQKCLEFENKWKKANDEAVHLTAEVRKLKSLNQEHGPPISEKSVQQWQNCQNAKQDIKQLKEIFRNAGVAQAQVNRLHPKIDGSYFHSGPQLFNQMQILRQISTIVERLESLISKIISQSQPE